MRLEARVLLVLLAAGSLFPLLGPSQYWLHIAVLIVFYSILASSLNLIVGYVGEFSLGHTAFLGIGAYTAALFARHAGWPMWLTIPAAGVIAALFGSCIGAITLRLRGPYFVIVTLAFAEVLRLIANNWIALTNGPMGLAGIPQSGIIDKRLFFYVILSLAAVCQYFCYRFVYSNAGRGAIAVRENRFVAQSIGIDPFASAMFAFVIGAFLAGLAGGFYAHYITFVGPDIFQFSFMLAMIIMLLIGGKGTLLGPLVGAAIVTLLEEYLRDVRELRLTFFGLSVMAIVLLLPNGIISLLPRPGHRPARRSLRSVSIEKGLI